VPAKTKKLKKWTDDFTDVRNWLIRQLGAFPGDQYFAAIFDHPEKRSAFKEKGQRKSDLLDSVCLSQNVCTTQTRSAAPVIVAGFCVRNGSPYQLAVFSVKLPSMEPEIDCKLQSNSR
jgi:hypothetical protein